MNWYSNYKNDYKEIIETVAFDYKKQPFKTM